MYMRKTEKMLIIVAGILMLGMSACNTHVYDEETYQKIIRYLSPVDSVDQRHNWLLTNNMTFRFTADAGKDVEMLKVFTENPLTSTDAELMNQDSISRGQTVLLSVSVPSVLTTLYAALVDKDNNYYVTPFSTGTRDVSFAEATEGTPAGTLWPQTYTYLFEENFPEPGDYDYNDLVLRISQERTGKKEVTIKVTISAVGGSYQMAGGLRLIGYRFQDIDSVKTLTGESFSDGVPSGSLYLFNKTDLLVQGRRNEAVINMFVDAHWAMAFNVQAEYGLFKRMKYNVAVTDGVTYQERAERSLSYVVYFNSESGLENFTLDTIDPFIITGYNGGTWETHLDSYRDAQVMYEYPVSTSLKDLPWALKIPLHYFKYPYEGVEIGFKKRTEEGTTAMFGAYTTAGHSFGEWAENYTQCHDWYQYPNSRQVY